LYRDSRVVQAGAAQTRFSPNERMSCLPPDQPRLLCFLAMWHRSRSVMTPLEHRHDRDGTPGSTLVRQRPIPLADIASLRLVCGTGTHQQDEEPMR
jgi:hypothetical protein